MPFAVPTLLSLALLACGPDEPAGGDGGGGDGGSQDGGAADGGGQPDDDGVRIIDATASLGETFQSFVTVSWTQEGTATTWVELSYDDDVLLTPPRLTQPGANQQLVLGLPYSEPVDWRLKYDVDGDLATTDDLVTAGAGEIITGSLPEGLPTPALLQADPDRWEPTGTYLLGSMNQDGGGWTGGTYWKFIVDRAGRVVWAHKTPDQHWSIYLRVAQSGDHLLWDEATYWSDWDGGLGSTVHRWYLDGTEIEEIATPGLHHAFTELPDGTLVWGAAEDASERLVKRESGSDQVQTIWDCGDFHAQAGSRDSCQSNTLYHHAETDTFLYSFYTTDTIVEIDHATGQSLWWAGGVPGGYAFDPPESQWSWQHGANYLDDGHLLTSTEDTHFGPADHTVAREYQVDHESGALVEVWSFGDGFDTYASTAGEAHRLPGGNTLHNYGSHGSLKEVTPDGDVVWELSWGGDRLLGRTVFLEDLYTFLPPTE
ncbi:aryl-sulfate sulfotransferase [Myxococcota bacterium]|nr:aryl-sulfate sulfotransferase [Myxococcota bacterium]